jgi:hypothetical protein
MYVVRKVVTLIYGLHMLGDGQRPAASRPAPPANALLISPVEACNTHRILQGDASHAPT